jgi:hypothetical protein
MKTNRTTLSFAAVVAAVLLVSACQTTSAPETKQIASQRAGDLAIVLESQTGELAQGQNRFTIAFRSAADNQPVDAGSVTVSSSMTMPGMAPMVAPIELQPAGETGKYAVTGDFGMSGAWRFEVRWDGPAGRGSTTFSSNVR